VRTKQRRNKIEAKERKIKLIKIFHYGETTRREKIKRRRR
jgi:hypothetical protein